MPTEACFYLLFTNQPTGFELMAECALCGAMTEQPLVVACGVVMRLDTDVLTRLREQAVGALAAIDRLHVP